jgi:hypothetical protein
LSASPACASIDREPIADGCIPENERHVGLILAKKAGVPPCASALIGPHARG